MQTVLLVVHVMLALAMIVTVLLQRSEGGALGIGGGGGGGAGGGLMTGRGAANLLTRTTAFLATGFFATSILLAVMAGGDRAPTSVIDSAPVQQQPVAPAGPSVPKQ
ncbi:MAG: preprotein translocase subunit SecG [Alphaproteobacteria bacterium]|nr:preprotein translocase subunit SecG [Alphaproteobacteria bacterium]MBT4085717.1 preprotein translocase subunit SecG [Alphaproteobacteria bacterium]MBT4543296.1 preprotein translocase subunit SecG [Alphaproteobacteria bacterium]MBT7747215.1 preprotein translocase subunit SecG [Alphaproteobacteria bacterium]